VLLLCRRPAALPRAEAEAWFRDEIDRVVSDAAVQALAVARVDDAHAHHPAEWDWLVELLLDDLCAASRTALGELVLDMQLLGMHPAMVAVGGPLDGHDR
jgi:hypothetical protein